MYMCMSIENPLLYDLDTVERENNKDYNQVLLDVQRSLRRFPPGE